MIRLRNLDEAQRHALAVRSYPGFPEFVLLDPPGTAPTGYHRGSGDDQLEIPEAEAWQRFLAAHYLPPVERRLLLLQPCSWAKPYDMSATLQPLAQLCRAYPFVHRVVMSNVGLVPVELQLNPLFCAYDWAPPQGEGLEDARRRYARRTTPRIVEYVERHLDHYAAVLLFFPTPAGGELITALRGLPLPLITVPNDESYPAIHAYPFRQPDDWARHPAALEHLRHELDRVAGRWSAVGLLPARSEPPCAPPLPVEALGRWSYPPLEVGA